MNVVDEGEDHERKISDWAYITLIFAAMIVQALLYMAVFTVTENVRFYEGSYLIFCFVNNIS